ncbi:MAG: hypothetical protein HYZ53_06920 [Planctomycetes bacterium]|nr:hypothetical protein [Planctomycetota bacterium]
MSVPSAFEPSTAGSGEGPPPPADPAAGEPPSPALERRVRAWTAALLLLSGVAGLLASTLSRPPGLARPSPPSEWKLFFSDLFDVPELGRDWRKLWTSERAGRWTIHDSALCFKGASDGFLLLDRAILGDFRVEFDTRVEPDSEYLGDLKCFVQVSESQAKIRTGENYVFAFGAQGNTRSSIFAHPRLPPFVPRTVEVGESLLARGRTLHVTLERRRNRLSIGVDHVPFLEYEEYFPPAGAGYSTLTFYSYRSHAHFDNLLIYSHRQMVPSTAFEEADRYYCGQREDLALAKYKGIYERVRDSAAPAEREVAAEARFKEALVHLDYRRVPEARAALEELVSPGGRLRGTDWESRASYHLAWVQAWEGEWEDAERRVEKLLGDRSNLHLFHLTRQFFGAMAPRLVERSPRADGAREYLRRALELAGEDPVEIVRWRAAASDVLWAQGDLAGAAAEKLALVRECPAPAEAVARVLFGLGAILARLGRIGELPEACETVARRFAMDAGAVLLARAARASADLELGRPEQARRELEEALRSPAKAGPLARVVAAEVLARAVRSLPEPADRDAVLATVSPSLEHATSDVTAARWLLFRTLYGGEKDPEGSVPDLQLYPEASCYREEKGDRKAALSAWKPESRKPSPRLETHAARILLHAAGEPADPAVSFDSLVEAARARLRAEGDPQRENDLEYFVGFAHRMAGRTPEAKACFTKCLAVTYARDWPYFEATRLLEEMRREGK